MTTRGLLILSLAKLRAEKFLDRAPRTSELLGKRYAEADHTQSRGYSDSIYAQAEAFLAKHLFKETVE